MLFNFLLRKGTLWGALFFYSFGVFAQNWQDLQWLRLLDYRKTLLGYESEADDQNFFVSPDGKYSPEMELKAFIQSLKEDDPDPKKNSFCRFPARVRWLKKFREVPKSKVACPDYEAYIKLLAPKSITIVFSSYYLNNPASSFGHTFIRLGKNSFVKMSGDDTAIELLDTGINYGAMVGNAHPVVFAIGGLSGYFYGSYNAIPYYYKVREYNDFETRDLWSYQLEMTQEEIDFITDHIWELAHTRFAYFFLTENCSYHVLSILEAARPSLNLHAKLPRLYTIPSETLKALMEEKLVKKITFRPSASTLFYHQLKQLDEKDREEVRNLVFNNLPVLENDPKKKAMIYDTAIGLVDYKFAKQILKGEEEAQSLKRPLLVARSKIPVRSPDLDFSDKMKEAPHLGHGQKRLMISGVNQENQNFTDLEWRFAFHDILDNDLGYPPQTKMEVVKTILRTDGNEFQLRDISFIDALLLGKWDRYNKAPSWKVKLGQWQTRDQGQDLTTQGVIGGYGISTESGIFNPYLLGHVETSYVSEKLFKFKFAYGSDQGVVVNFSRALKFQTALEWRVYPWNESRFVNELRLSNQKYGLGLYEQVYLVDGVQDIGIRGFFYF